MTSPKRIAILGSTGSIGTQALEVVNQFQGLLKVDVLSAHSNAEILIKQAKQFHPSHVVVTDPRSFLAVKAALNTENIEVLSGLDELASIVTLDSLDIILTAMVGYAGLLPTLKAVQVGKTIALANKETLVVAGELITRLATENQASIIPVDSEHSAIFQCLVGEQISTVDKIILTASGGPFRTLTLNELNKVTKKEALEHPNWTMGQKITIDSATLMNKGLEAIEARWLFDVQPDQIDVVVHPQSVIHSMVQFKDGSIKAQMGIPDMKLPIRYALNYPKRIDGAYKQFNFSDYPQLTFEYPDTKKFKNLEIAFEAMRQGGNVPCIMNAANEIAVEAFLNDKVGFAGITNIIEKTIEKATILSHPGYDDYVESDTESRRIARTLI